ncbi:AAA family ATPase [Aestuariivirga sp.]|uniref:AAA family ATPase n=1 Tax=Aestuariivirga sp. TaxID=2650926 RepID=UPI0039E2BD7F
MVMMEHFAVIQSIIRAGLSGDRAALEKQVGRLRERLQKKGAENEAATLTRLLSSSEEVRELSPTRVEVSRVAFSGEKLVPDVHLPVDRETGARLCSVEFWTKISHPPVLTSTVKEAVEGLISEWERSASLQAVGVEPTRSLLIYGPPGSGKTVTAGYISQRLGLPLVVARIDGLISSFLGTTARNIANLFDFCNRYACVLLLDEFDALAKLRDDPQEMGEIKRVVNTLLQNLDRRRGFGITIAITNHDRLLDPAVWRRFETQVHMDEPDMDARQQLVSRFLAPIPASSATLKIFAYVLAQRSGADVERICMAVKRTVALSNSSQDAPGMFRALSTVLARDPSGGNAAAQVLAQDPEAFVSLVANDLTLAMRQSDIGDATGYGQSRVSELKKAKRHVLLLEHQHAQ